MKSGWIRSHAVILIVLSAVISWPAPLSAQSDPIIIRGAEGTEQSDVRLGQQHYGPITRRDTLWSIANQYRPHSSVTLQQTMAAIMHANPTAFPSGNPNEMESGYFLRIPSLQEIQMVNPEAARRQIELGETLQQSQRELSQTRQQTAESAQQRNEMLTEARLRAEQAVGEVRSAYMEEINELRERMRSSIESTEAAFQQNEALRERVDRIAEVLDEIQQNMVNEQEFQQQLQSILEQQDELRLEQETSRTLAESQSTLDRMLSNPLMIALLAFIPALFMIILATLLLRRRDASEQALEPVTRGAAGAAGAATGENESQVLDEGSDDFELDDAMADFDQLDEDEGDDLSALEDEMLVPEGDTNDGIQLDENTTELDFDALATTDEESEQGSSAPADETTDETSKEDSDLSQTDLDELLAEEEPEDEKATEEESPSEIYAAASDDEQDDQQDNEQQGETDSAEDVDFDALMDEFGMGEEDDSIEDEDIDSLLARSDDLVADSEEENTQGEQERPADVEEAEELDANEELEFGEDDDTAQDDDEFIDIDDILNETDEEPEDAEDEDENDNDLEAARRADEEDNLAAQLDLARAYLEMEEVDEARETVQAVIEEAEGELLEEAKALLERIES